MQKENLDFYTLIHKLIKLETKYERIGLKLDNSSMKLVKFDKTDDRIAIIFLKSDSKNINMKINELTLEILCFEQDNNMKEYFKLYEEKSLLVKEVLECENELENMKNSHIYTCSSGIDIQFGNEKKELKKTKCMLKKQIKEIDTKMRNIRYN